MVGLNIESTFWARGPRLLWKDRNGQALDPERSGVERSEIATAEPLWVPPFRSTAQDKLLKIAPGPVSLSVSK